MQLIFIRMKVHDFELHVPIDEIVPVSMSGNKNVSNSTSIHFIVFLLVYPIL
jgi:hypothetical protein